MKKLFTLLCLAAVPAMAQPTYTSIAIPPNNTAVSSKSVAYTGDLPTSGANQTWDYTSITFPNAASTNTAKTNLNDTPRASSFPTATYYEVSASGSEIFYNITSTQSSILGNYNPANGGTTIVNSDVQNAMTVPFNYGETQTDTYGATYVANTITTTKVGTIQVDYNAYGTLKTVDGTYNNVPMITAKTDETHSFEIVPGTTFDTRFVSTTYSWGYPGEYTFLFAILKIETYNFGMLTNTSITAMKPEQIPTGLFNASETNSAIVFPQPAKDQVTISAEKLNGQCKATVYTLQGDAVNSTELIALDHAVTLDVQSLEKGIYVVELNNEGQLFRSKLVVQ